MTYQRRLIPSTSMLMAFDASARTGSFTGAARELNLTPGAISRQVGALEDQLDTVLFKRIRKTVELTDTGRTYAQEIDSALKIIRNASLNAMSSPLSGILNLAILPTFGTRWLMPRFPGFLTENPNITVNFVTKLSPFDFHNEHIHAAIHFGLPNWPGTENTFLMNEISTPVCSQSFLKEHPIKDPKSLSNVPLLHLSSRPNAWRNWFESNNLEAPAEQGILFEQISIIAQAAAAGLGAALLPKFLIQGELERGELTIALDIPSQSQSGYYLVTPLDKANYAPAIAFKNWLLNEIHNNP